MELNSINIPCTLNISGNQQKESFRKILKCLTQKTYIYTSQRKGKISNWYVVLVIYECAQLCTEIIV